MVSPTEVSLLQVENETLKASLAAQQLHSESLKRSLELRQFGGKPFPTTQSQVIREVVRLRKESHSSAARLLALEHQNKMLSGAFKVRARVRRRLSRARRLEARAEPRPAHI